jgi:hypothetical protein
VSTGATSVFPYDVLPPLISELVVCPHALPPRRDVMKTPKSNTPGIIPFSLQTRLWEGELGCVLGKEALFCAAKRAVVWLEKVSIIKVF